MPISPSLFLCFFSVCMSVSLSYFSFLRVSVCRSLIPYNRVNSALSFHSLSVCLSLSHTHTHFFVFSLSPTKCRYSLPFSDHMYLLLHLIANTFPAHTYYIRFQKSHNSTHISHITQSVMQFAQYKSHFTHFKHHVVI